MYQHMLACLPDAIGMAKTQALGHTTCYVCLQKFTMLLLRMAQTYAPEREA
jgi:hypothetical protein